MPGPEKIRDRLDELNQAIAKEGIKLKVLPGMEIALDPNIADLLDHGKVQALAGTSYVLIEPPFQRLPLGWEQAFFAVLSKGFMVFFPSRAVCPTGSQTAFMRSADRIRRLFPGQLGQFFRPSWPHDSENGYLSGRQSLHSLPGHRQPRCEKPKCDTGAADGRND